MTASSRFPGIGAVLLASLAAAPAAADSGRSAFPTTLSGYNETPLTLNSPGSGEFLAKVAKDEASLAYVLTYRDLPSGVTQAHIHFGRPGLTGGIVLFLCTNLTPPSGVPTPPPCPAVAGTVTGTLTAADVRVPAGQGIDAAAAGFAEIIRALRNGAAYANVHTTQFPTGEIRGPLGNAPDDEDDD